MGFPGSDRSGRKKIEGINALQQRSGPYIQHTFAESDFRTSLDTGDARKTPIRMKVDADPEAYYFVHGANTAHGNSGGPLLCSDGTAVGINTLGLIQEKGQNYALTLNQLRREIDAHAEGVVWRKHPE